MNTIKKMWEDVKLYAFAGYVLVAGTFVFYFFALCVASFVNQVFGGQPLDVFELANPLRFFHR